MDLHFNDTALFTRWIVQEQLLREPFVVVDVGVLGGENQRWHLLGDYLVVHGFDAIEQEVEKLREANRGNPRRHYHWCAAGNEDGEREFFFNSSNPTSSSFYAQGEDRHSFGAKRSDQAKLVPMRRLDSLLSEGVIPPADFLKVDVEGFEKDVFTGAQSLLANGVLGVETETNFNVSETYPEGHFATLHRLLLAHHLLVFDLNFNRIPRAEYQRALESNGMVAVTDQISAGKVSTVNALFLRDLIDEADRPRNYVALPPPVGVEKIIKAMIVYELHGLNDVAIDTAQRFRDRLGERFDVDRACALLADPFCRGRPARPDSAGTESVAANLALLNGLRSRVRELETSTSWRVTAPLRALRAATRKFFGS